MDCEICEDVNDVERMFMCVDEITMVCESCTDNIAFEMTLVRGEFKEGA